MEWVMTLTSGLIVALMVGPPLVLLGGLAVLVAASALLPAGPTVSRAGFDCPFSRRHVTVDFLVWPGAGEPGDALACSAFREPTRIRCKKACLSMAETRWGVPVQVPRYSLVAGGVAVPAEI